MNYFTRFVIVLFFHLLFFIITCSSLSMRVTDVNGFKSEYSSCVFFQIKYLFLSCNKYFCWRFSLLACQGNFLSDRARKVYVWKILTLCLRSGSRFAGFRKNAKIWRHWRCIDVWTTEISRGGGLKAANVSTRFEENPLETVDAKRTGFIF